MATAVLALAGVAVSANAAAISPADITSSTFVSWNSSSYLALPSTSTDFVAISGIQFTNALGAQASNNVFLVPDSGSWDLVAYVGAAAPPSLFMPPASFSVGPQFSIMPSTDYSNFSGTVNGDPVDFMVTTATLANPVSSQNPTPEPSTLGILALGLVVVQARRKTAGRQ